MTTMLNKIISAMSKAKSIAILPHVSVDGDGLGSSLALAMALKKINKKVNIYLEEDVPYIYNFLPGKDMLEVYQDNGMIFDMVVAVDTGDIERLGKRADIFNAARITANIDHHQTNSEFAFFNFVQTSSSAVGEIIYQLIKMMNISIDLDMSTCLYVSIATDTGGFRFSNTTSITHQIAADLINNGVNIAEISQKIFDTTSYEKVRLMGLAASSIELFEYSKIAFITLTDEDIKSVGAKEEDCDGIVNMARNIRGVEVAVMFRQRVNGEIKANFRSKSYIDVAAIANMYSGGGHKRAAGCTINKPIKEAKEMVLKDIREVLM